MTAAGSDPAPDSDEITRDTLLRGRVTLFQPRRGFRSSLDPVLLSAFLVPPFGHFLDIGCGTGALSFLLLARDPGATGVGVEIQPRLGALVERAIAANAVADRFRLAIGDVRQAALPAASFDVVASNPPFRPVGEGDLPPDPERATAHHEVTLTLAEWVTVAARACRPAGRIAAVFPAARAEELVSALAASGFAAVRSREVLPRAGTPPTRVLVEARRGEAAVVAEPPLVVHTGSGYSDEVQAMLI